MALTSIEANKRGKTAKGKPASKPTIGTPNPVKSSKKTSTKKR